MNFSIRRIPLKVILIFILLCTNSLADPTLPSGFTISTLASNITAPTNISFSPDGRIFVSQKGGQLRVIKNGVLLDQPFVTVDTDTQGEHGLIGVAFDPNFFNNFYVYVYYVATTPTIHARVSRFTAAGDVAKAGSEKAIIDLDDRGTSIYHVSGDLHFGLDGKLYISSGDNAGVPFTDNAQRLTSTLGKILRINSDGTIPQDNPFISSTTGIDSAIWAYGLRNPFTFSIQSTTGKIYVNDVGQSSWEEINNATTGGLNFGWPIVEGMGTNPSYINPIFTYGHGAQTDDTLGCAITGGDFYNPVMPQFPNQYVGQYFFIDYCNNWIHTFNPLTGVEAPFGSNVSSSALGLRTGPDGNIYFLSEWFNAIFMLSYSGQPAPAIITQPSNQLVAVGYPVTFNVTVSGSAPLSYQWQENGVNIAGATSSTYTFTSPQMTDNGALFTCVISNAYGKITSSAASLKVINQAPPTASIDFPFNGTTYNAGDTIYFGGSASDPVDQLTAEAYTWEIHFQHDTHFHPFFPPTSGITEGSFTIPTQGETSFNTWYRIFLTVKDSQGLSTTVTREIFPNKSVFYLKTSPPGLNITLDGQPLQTPTFVTGVVGFNRTLGVVSPQTVNGVTYQFQSWSDGLAATHTFATSAETRTYTATYLPVGSTRSGTLIATPNPAFVCDNSNAGTTTLEWNSQGTKNVEIHINAPNGNLLAASGAGPGSITTQKWIGDGSTFYLQDVSNGLPLTADNTLATVTVNLTDDGCSSFSL